MKKHRFVPLLSVAALVSCCVLAVALSNSREANAKDLPSLELYSFEAQDIPARVRSLESSLNLVSGPGVSQGKQALEIEFAADVDASGVEFAAADSWDCSRLGNCRLSFDATNTSDVSIHLRCAIQAANGGRQTRTVAVPAGSSDTYYFELKADDLGTDYGLRDDPPSLDGVGKKMIVQSLKQKVNYEKIKSIRIYVQSQLRKKTLVIDNLQIVSNPAVTSGHLAGLVDRFGQNAKVDFEIKIKSEEQLKQVARDELESLKASRPLAHRGKYGGWKAGPKLSATGYFRTEKVGKKWALVDPEGYLYFATGIANNRMANLYTFSGVDFSDPSVRKVDPEDVTPKDSQVIKVKSDEVRKTRVIASEMRHKMFKWLPDYSDPLAKYYGYRRSAHRGPMQHGEVFSFYLANLERRYGEPTPGHAESKWFDVTVDRMLDWGFTSMGNWTDPGFYHKDRIPYFANGWIIGEFKTVSSGFDYWGAMPDPFDPEFVRRAEITTQVVSKEVKGNPWCVGVFIDNEKSWGNPSTLKGRFGIVLHALGRNSIDCPTKAAFMRLLKKKYSTIDALNQAWSTDIDSWQEMAKGVDLRKTEFGSQVIDDFSILLEAYATEYFRVVHDALEDVLPNHLYLGPRFAPWGLTPEVRKASRKYCDVISYNYYREGLGSQYWEFLDEVDMPSIIGEFHMGATDTGLFHPGLIHAADPKDRARMWKVYMESVIDNPYFVGAHWFQYIDSPITGRAHDGENYNVGFATVTDVPYPHMIEAAKKLHKSLYDRRFGDVPQK